MIDIFLPLASWAATAAITAIVSTVVGTTVTVVGQQQAAKAADSAARADAQQKSDAARAKQAEAHEAALRQHREARRQLAALRATLAGSGTQLNDGSNLDILGAATTRLESRVNDDARRRTIEANNLLASASQSLTAGRAARTEATYASLGTVLEGSADLTASLAS